MRFSHHFCSTCCARSIWNDGQRSSPRISIITATFNAAEQLPHTMRSLREQTFMEFEWIVVDGNSTDGTQALLQENDDLVSRCISEPDRGIYDAFNKGCALARGEWLLFLGAGDELSSPQTLAECDKYLESINAETTLVYGRLTLLSPVARAALETYGEPWDEIKHRWDNGRPAMPPHGAAFHRRSLFNDSQFFDLRFPIAADSHFMFRISRLHGASVHAHRCYAGPCGWYLISPGHAKAD